MLKDYRSPTTDYRLKSFYTYQKIIVSGFIQLLLIGVLSAAASAQDSLFKKKISDWVKQQPPQTTADSVYNLHNPYDDEDPHFYLQLAKMILEKSKKDNYVTGQGIAHTIIANCKTFAYNKEVSLPHRDTAIQLLSLTTPGKSLAQAYMHKAQAIGDLGRFDSMNYYFEKALTITKKQQLDSLTVEILLRSVLGNRRGGKYVAALNAINEAKKIAEEKKMSTFYGGIDTELADLFQYSGNDSMYSWYAKRAYQYALQYNSGLPLARLLNKTASVFFKTNDTVTIRQIGLKLDSLDALQLFKKISVIRNSFYARWYKLNKQPEKALGFLFQNFLYQRKNNFGTEPAYLFSNIGECYLQMGNFQKAELYFDSAYVLAKQRNYQQVLADLLPMMVTVYEKNGNTITAFALSKELTGLNRELANKDNSTRIAVMQAMYDLQNREQTIELLKKDNELTSVQLRQQKALRWLFLISGILLLGFIGILIYSLKKIRIDNSLLRKQKQEIEEQSHQLLLQAASISRYKTQMNPHFIYNAINSVQLMAMRNDGPGLINYLQDFSRLMRKTLDNSDKDFISLRTETDYLQEYLEFEKKRLSNTFRYSISIDKSIDAENILIPPMLLQPLVENAVKHAVPQVENGKISIAIHTITEKGKPLLKIMIDDNGPGLWQKEINIYSNITHSSKGLLITRQRLKELLLKNDIDREGIVVEDKKISMGESGVRVTILLPYLEEF